MTITEDFNIWASSKDVPTVVISFALPEEKEFQVQSDVLTPLVDIYDTTSAVVLRRRVFEF